MDNRPPIDGEVLKGLLDTLVLDELREAPNYGFGIRERLSRRLGTEGGIVKEATLYPLLHRLEERGFLAAHHEPGARGRPRKYYRLTPEGTAFLEHRLEEWRRVAALLERTVLGPRDNGEGENR